MQTLEKGMPELATGEGNDNIYPPVETAQRSGDGEGDGRLIAAGIDTAESYANSGTLIELSGINLVEMVYGATRRTVLRNKVAIPTGRLAVRREMPTILS